MTTPARVSISHAEFEQALRRGLGRAVLWLQDGSASPDRELILHACTHNLAYDRQTEDNRALYMSDIIAATGEPEFYARRVEEALSREDEEQSESQMFDLLGLLAKAGDAAARRTLYRYFEAHAVSHFHLAETLVDVDGLAGYLFAIRQWIAHPIPEDDHWYEAFLLRHTEKRLGAEVVQAALREAAQAEPAVSNYLAAVEEERTAWEARRKQRPPRPQPGYDSLRRLIADPSKRLGRMVWARFGERLDAADAERAAQALLAETDTGRLERFLYLFGRRPFPLDPSPLLELAQGENPKVTAAALFALVPITHPSVRTLALDKIETSARPWEALALLVRNYRDGDHIPIEHLFDKSWDTDELHWIGLSLRDVFEENPSPSAAPALMLFYEQGFCTLCRHGVVELLAGLGPLPPGMLAECRYDADKATRALVRPMTPAAGD